MEELTPFLLCIESLYAAATNATLWSSALENINRFLKSPASVLYVVDTSSGAIPFWISVGFPDQMLEDYTAYWHTQSSNYCLAPEKSIPELRYFGLGYDIGDCLHEEAHMQMYFSTNRTVKQGLIQDTDIQRYQRIAPHLAIAANLSLKLSKVQVQAESAYALLAALRSGVVMVDRFGAITYCNPAAERILSRRDALAVDNGNLVALRPSDHYRLQAAIAAVVQITQGEIAEHPGPLSLLRKGGEPGYVVTVTSVTPSKPALFLSQPTILLVIDDPAYALRAPTHMLQCVFRLTPRETEIAAALLAGAGPSEIAQQLGITRTTVDTHLRQIYRKTGTSNLRQALRVLLQSTFSSI